MQRALTSVRFRDCSGASEHGKRAARSGSAASSPQKPSAQQPYSRLSPRPQLVTLLAVGHFPPTAS